MREQNREGKPGELAVIYDRKDEFLAVGLFDPDSPIRARILHTGKPQTIDRNWWARRLREALAKREEIFKDDQKTNGYRCLNGESDGWPGLVLDRYDTTLVLKLYSAAWLPRLDEVQELINEAISNERIVLRLSRNIQEPAANYYAKTDGQILTGKPLSGPVVFSETGLLFEADVLRGQKTGFFLDQRENRRLVESLARGRRMLNAFSFSGGFSLYAARGGARSVTDLDISTHALEAAKRNFKLNCNLPAIAGVLHKTIQSDTFDWLEETRERFDLVVLDPPSLAKRESERNGAIRAYQRLASLGIRALNRSGILVAASCSAHVNANEFFEAVRGASSKSGRTFTEPRTTGHAPDHPANFKEAEYLKAIYVEFKT